MHWLANAQGKSTAATKIQSTLKRINKYGISCRLFFSELPLQSKQSNVRFKIEDLVARRWYWKLTCFHHNIRDILLSVSISVLAASSTWREGKEDRKSPKFISLNIPHTLRDTLLTCMLHAGYYPIMPCKCTRPYSPRVFLYTVCLSVLRCISKSEKNKQRRLFLSDFCCF